jgi:pimeloyl-ACP methyl ester carboxylesterase
MTRSPIRHPASSGVENGVDRNVDHTVLGADGTSIHWHAHTVTNGTDGRPRAGEPPVILTTGLGTTANFWKPLIAGLVSTYDLVNWDYRGHASSEVARSGDYSMATQADDLARVTEAACAAASGKAPVHVAFSMGVTVLLELYRRRPDLVGAMALVAGGADHPYASSPVLRVPGTRAALRAGLRGAAPWVPRLAPVIRRVLTSPVPFALGRAVGALTPEAPRDELEHFFEAMSTMDLNAYWGTLRALFEAHGADVLRTIRVPVLIISPAKDLLAPKRDLERLRRDIPGARWEYVPGTGHAILLEAGDAVVRHVRDFLGRLPASTTR